MIEDQKNLIENSTIPTLKSVKYSESTVEPQEVKKKKSVVKKKRESKR